MSKNNKKSEKEKLLAEIERLKKELKRKKKYGLVWEEKSEQVVVMCKEKLPVLKEVKNKEIKAGKDKPINLLIEGDNYHALSVLNYTHAKKVDVIYIDPPYNTGNKDFIFNDRYIDKEDTYRHSKWLSFMEKRLKLAKNLLKDTGVIFISIDDNEMPQLKLLMDNPDLFGEQNFVNTIALRVSPPNSVKITHASKTIIKEKEYLVVYARNRNKASFVPQFKRADKWDNHFNLFIEKPSKNYLNWIVVPLKKKLYELGLKPDLDNEKFINWVSQNSDNIFQSVGLAKIKGIKKYQTDKITSIDGMNGYLAYKGRQVQLLSKSLKDTDLGFNLGRLLCDLWIDVSFNNLFQEGGVDLKFGKKPVQLIKRIVKLSTTFKNAIILDFFAGSGTTGEAVLGLNKEDGGNRQFILCTDNKDENGGHKICTDICYPRLKNAVFGYKNRQGFGGNLKYFKTDFVDYDEPTDKNKIKLTAEATEMLCVKERTFEKVLDRKDFRILKNVNHYIGIIFDQAAIPAFKKAIKNIKGKFSVYVFSLGDETFDDEFKDVKQRVKLSPIPEAILRVYRRIFK